MGDNLACIFIITIIMCVWFESILFYFLHWKCFFFILFLCEQVFQHSLHALTYRLHQEKVGVLMWHNCIYTGITVEGSDLSCT